MDHSNVVSLFNIGMLCIILPVAELVVKIINYIIKKVFSPNYDVSNFWGPVVSGLILLSFAEIFK